MKSEFKVFDKVRIVSKSVGQRLDTIRGVDIFNEIGTVDSFRSHTIMVRFDHMIYKFKECDLKLHIPEFLTLEEFTI